MNDEIEFIDLEEDNSAINEDNSNKPESDQPNEKNTTKEVVKEVISWVLTFAVAIAAALFIKSFIIINATVPTGSMENTIMPGDDLIGFRLSYAFSEPERGDIIIFKFPDDESQKYVKRIIGLPGEKITIKDAKVYINDSSEPLEEEYLKDEWIEETGPYEYEVPEDCYLVLGDNRNNSKDSRYWVNTYVTKDEIIGKASFVYFPFNRFGSLY